MHGGIDTMGLRGWYRVAKCKRQQRDRYGNFFDDLDTHKETARWYHGGAGWWLISHYEALLGIETYGG